MLDWNEINEPEHRDMFIDVKKMMASANNMRKFSLCAREAIAPNLKAVQYEANIECRFPTCVGESHRNFDSRKS